MPICKRDGYENFSKNFKKNTFQDTEEVFYCETTKQIFSDYEEYFRHVMVINSTIWQCEATKRENLTYAEALKSERRARKKRDQFNENLRPVVMLVIEKAQQACLKSLCRLAYAFIRSRFFVNEEVKALFKSTNFTKYTVVGVVPTTPTKSPPDGNVYDPTKVQYNLRKSNGSNSGKEYKIPHENIRRTRNSFSHEHLKMFIEDNVIRVEGILRPKPETYKKYVTDKKLTFSKTFIGNMPYFEPAKPKKADDVKKQSTMSKFLTKTEPETPEEEAARLERSKALLKDMERIRKEKEEAQALADRKKAERLALIEEQATSLAKKTDDLERFDQKPLPKFQKVVTNIPTKLFGDCIMVKEFLHSFGEILSGNVFRNNISFYELSRAFTTREIIGPLSDIVMVLLGTIFSLQQEEEAECSVEYIRVKHNDQQPFKTINKATKTHEYVNRHYSFKLNEIPLDAHTVSEVLRLHFLASGAQVNDKAERWRLMYRNGYYSNEDPGLIFRMQQPHILRALKMYSIYQLPMTEVLRIIHTLMSQILSYSTPINLIAERMEQVVKSKTELKLIVTAEKQRVSGVESERKKLVADHAVLLKEKPDQARFLEDKLNKKVAELFAFSARDKKKFDNKLEELRNSLFDNMIFLGMDRAYRRYYVLESIPAVFVEHPIDSQDVCMENPPKNNPNFVGCPRTLREIRYYLSRIYTELEKSDSKKRKSQGQGAKDNKENKENQAVLNGDVKMNGDATKTELNGEVEEETTPQQPPPPPPTQYELMMCTGDPKNCIVHDGKNPDHQLWSYFYKEEDIDAVINSLNSLGERESALKENLTTMRELIVNHAKNCPVDVLSLDGEANSEFSRFKALIKNETRRKYNAANFGFPDDHDLSEVLFAMLVDRVLRFEYEITTGNLGKLKIKDIEKWRQDIQSNTYDPQCELQWGSDDAVKKPHKDPGKSLGETIDIDSEDSADEGISLHDSSLLRKCVNNLSSALLQIEQGIEQKFMKEPFGVNRELHEKKMEPLLEKGRERLKQWEISLMNATSYSQVFLHLNILYSAVKWRRSANKSLCAICRRGNDPEKMLLCDDCNAGTHMFCMKPKLKSVPRGDWFCTKCTQARSLKEEVKEKKVPIKRAAFVLDEDDNASEGSTSRRQSKHLRTDEIEEELANDDDPLNLDEEEMEDEEEELADGEEELDDTQDTQGENELTIENGENDESEDEEICAVCSYEGGEIACYECKSVYHLECAELRRAPRGNWNCKSCKSTQSKRKSKQNDDSTDDEDFEEPLVKRGRSSTSSKRSSIRDSFGADEIIRTNNNNNRRRRAGENLPLNSSILYTLLEDIMKNDNSWPFLRPVMHSEVPDYHTIIKEPMDFAKVKSKLNMGKYTINEELLKDIELVFKNCDIYNQEGNEIYEAGSALERFVMEKCKELNLPFQPSDMNRS